MKDVAITGGNAQVDNNVMTQEQAFAKVKSYSQTESAYVWDAKSKQLIEKPVGTRSGKWSKANGSCMFMWADEVINEQRIEDSKPKPADLSLFKHETFPNGREGQHTWTQSRRIAKYKDTMLVTAQEAKDYINKHGALV